MKVNKDERNEHNTTLHDSSDFRLSVFYPFIRFNDKKLLCWNGLIWSLGNTFVSTALLIYILFELVDKSNFRWVYLTTAFLTALPRIIGVFQLFAPQFLKDKTYLSQKAALFYALSGLSLCLIPILILFQNTIHLYWLIAGLIVLWTLHHLNEYIGNIAIDCMVGELIPENHRGKYYASRSRYMLIGTILASVIAFLMKGYTFPINHHLFWAGIGAVIILLSIIPLLFCTSQIDIQNDTTNKQPGSDVPSSKAPSGLFEMLFSPFQYTVFWLFLFYGVAFSFVNGLTQTTQYEYSVYGLGISYEFYMLLTAFCRIGQWCLNWIAGPWSDKAIRPTLMISQGIVAFSLLFLGIASTDFYYLPLVLSWLCLSGYSGLNIGIPKYLQSVSQMTGNRSASFALYYAVSGLAFAFSVMLSGFLLDLLGFAIKLREYTLWGIPAFACILFVGFILRLTLVPVLWLTIRSQNK